MPSDCTAAVAKTNLSLPCFHCLTCICLFIWQTCTHNALTHSTLPLGHRERISRGNPSRPRFVLQPPGQTVSCSGSQGYIHGIHDTMDYVSPQSLKYNLVLRSFSPGGQAYISNMTSGARRAGSRIPQPPQVTTNMASSSHCGTDSPDYQGACSLGLPPGWVFPTSSLDHLPRGVRRADVQTCRRGTWTWRFGKL